MDYIWIIFAALSAIILAIYSKKVDKAQHPGDYKKSKKGKKAKKAKKQKAPKLLRENRMLELSLAGLFLGIVASFYLTDMAPTLITGGFFAGLVLGMIFRKKTYVESLDELEIEDVYAPDLAYEETATEPEAEIITAE